MFLELLFWMLVIFSFVFGWGWSINAPWGRYGYFPLLVLVIILGLRVFGVPH